MQPIRLLIALALLVLVQGADARAQLGSGRQQARATLGVSFQQYIGESFDLTQVSAPLSVYLPFSRGLSLSVATSPASVSGSRGGGLAVQGLSGATDAQVTLNYAREIGGSSAVLSFGANLPSGKERLTADEFETSILLSQHYYDFRVPTFGQGLSFSPGLLWAFPLSENVVAGLGAAYQYRGAYTPLAGEEREYDPGDELLLTLGLDFRLDPRAAISGDVSFTRYGEDSWGEETFGAGSKITASAQYLRYLGFDEMRLLARYRSRSRISLPASDEDMKVVPDQSELLAYYRRRVTEPFYLGLLARGRVFSDVAVVFREEVTALLDLGLMPEVALSRNVSVPIRFVYTFGGVSGYEAGAGLTVRF